MAILATLLGILAGSYALLTLADRLLGGGRIPSGPRGRVSLALLFLFTGAGHFLRTDQMAEMLPPWIPGRLGLVYLTGVLEWAGAVGLLIPRLSRPAGMCLVLVRGPTTGGSLAINLMPDPGSGQCATDA